jgi:hypothetical protein
LLRELRSEPDFVAHITGFEVPDDATFPARHTLFGQTRTVHALSDLVPPAVAGPVALAGLLRVWAAVYRARSGEVVAGLTVPEIDDLGGLPGLGWAMCEVGWADQEEGPAVRFPGLAEWFGDNRVSPDAIRMRRHRARKREGATCDAAKSVTVTSPVTSHVTHGVTPVTSPVTPERNAGVTEEGREKTKDRIDICGSALPLSQPSPTASPDERVDPVELMEDRRKRLDASFNEFWAVWPRKENAFKARQKWDWLAPDPALTERILAAARAWAQVFAARPNDMVPLAWGWIQDQRWTDALPPPPEARPARTPAKAPDPDLEYRRQMAEARKAAARKDAPG